MREKPNFEQMAKEATSNMSHLVYLRRGDIYGDDSGPDWLDLTTTRKQFFISGCERIWSDYVIPLQKQIEELQKGK